MRIVSNRGQTGTLYIMNFLELLSIITPQRRVLVFILVLLLMGSALSLLNPWIAGQFTGLLTDSGNPIFSNINVILLAWLVLLAIKSLLSFASNYLIGSTGEVITANLRTRLYDHLQALSLNYHQQQRTGDMLTLLSNDAEVISHFVSQTLVQLLPLFMTLIGAFVMMVLIDPVIAFLAIGLLPLYFIAMKLIGRRIRPLTRQRINAYSTLVSFVEENLSLLPAIKAFTRESVETERFEEKNKHLLNVSKAQLFAQSILSPAIGFAAGMGLLLILWLASENQMNGQLNAAELVSLLLYAVLLSRPISGLADVYGQVQRTRGAAERIQAIFSIETEPYTKGKPFQAKVRGDIRFSNISFAYPERPEVLNQLDLDISAGETIAITGENGAGKSTLVHLLMRMIDVNAGKITLDGIDIAEISLSSLRRQIGLVAQHTLLLNGTVAENIAYGSPMIVEANIEQAAIAAHAHDFIIQLPKGYNTIIGDQGLRLSGGQRQRISLARTLLKDPPILVLDEATSMFDPEGEKHFIKECRQLLSKRTVILITHRPASLALADRIIELKSGKVLTTTD